MRVFEDMEFHDWACDEGLTHEKLGEVVAEIEKGLVDARLGGFLIKKRVSRAGRGKSGGYRTIIAHRQGERLVFLHGFGKNEKDNVSKKERLALLKLGDHYMKLSEAEMSKLVREKLVIEVRWA
jgi:hypothetical protein